jgi:hypothetical protein
VRSQYDPSWCVEVDIVFLNRIAISFGAPLADLQPSDARLMDAQPAAAVERKRVGATMGRLRI